ncbi:hypothetical protein TWF281_001781 [Arthrobotrys megalospora]
MTDNVDNNVIFTHSSVATVYAVITLLSTKLPTELVLEIIDFAGYYPRTTLGSCKDRASASARRHEFSSVAYLSVNIPYLVDIIDPQRRSNNKLKERQEGGGRRRGRRPGLQRVIRKMVFKFSVHGYSFNPPGVGLGDVAGVEDLPQFEENLTWLAVEIWRQKSDTYKEDMKMSLDSQKKIIEINGGDGDDEGAHHHWCMHHGYTKIGEEEEEGEGEGILSGEERCYKVGTWILKRNLSSRIFRFTDSTVVWDARIDGPGPDVEKWGSKYGYKDERGKPMGFIWIGHGAVENGGFVRELREGDEVRVVLRAYDYHVCSVQNCEIECWWTI